MSALLLDSRPPGRGPTGRGPASAGSASSSRRPRGGPGGHSVRRDSPHQQQQAPPAHQPLLRASTAGPSTSTGYRRLREPLEENTNTQEHRRIRGDSSRGSEAWVMVDPESNNNTRGSGGGSRENTPSGLLSERRSFGLEKAKNMPRPHTEGPFRRPLRPRPVTAATPTEGRSSVLSCHSKRVSGTLFMIFL